MKYLITGFLGAQNSSRIIVENIKPNHQLVKLYLHNNFEICVQQLKKELRNQNIDRIISFGQKPVTKAICIETAAHHKGALLQSNYNYLPLIKYLKDHNLNVRQSVKPGNYLCNHIFYQGLRFIQENKLQTNMLFVHTPYIHNFTNVQGVADAFSDYMLMDLT